MEQIRALCDEVLVLEEGRVVMQGDPESAIRCYEELMRKRTERRAAQLSGADASPSLVVETGSRQGTYEAAITAITFYDANGQAVDALTSGEPLTIDLEYQLTHPVPDMTLTLGIFNETHVKCYETVVPSVSSSFGPLNTHGRISCCLAEVPLLAGRYYVNVGLYPPDWSYVYDYHWQIHLLFIIDRDDSLPEASGIVSLRPTWSGKELS